MNADQIAQALNRGPTSAEAIALQQACETRRVAIRARLAQIDDTYPTGGTPEREAAIRNGLAALEKIDAEIAHLNRELDMLVLLEGQCVTAIDSALTAEARVAIPAARKKLPAALVRVRDAVAALDAAIASANAQAHVIAGYERLADRALPLTDDELTELLKVRALVWTARNVAVLRPISQQTHPQSWALFYDQRDGGLTRIERTPGAYLPDFTQGVMRGLQ